MQDKVRAELVEVLGPERSIQLDQDRNRLPYCMAFLLETFRCNMIKKKNFSIFDFFDLNRFCAISGFGAPHQVRMDISFWQKNNHHRCSSRGSDY